MIDDMIRIKESDPPTNVILSPTVPVTCPPSEMSVNLDQSVGLYISDCSVHFTDPLANETITIVALKSSSGFSRIARIVFSAISSPGSPWHGYIPAHCPVCARYNVQDFALLLQFITVARDSGRLLYFGRVIFLFFLFFFPSTKFSPSLGRFSQNFTTRRGMC